MWLVAGDRLSAVNTYVLLVELGPFGIPLNEGLDSCAHHEGRFLG